MIVQLLLSFFHGLAVTLFGWLHDALPGPPDFVTGLVTAVNTVGGLIPSSVRYFVPLGPIAGAGVAFVGLIVALGALRLARRVLSLFTGGGGNA